MGSFRGTPPPRTGPVEGQRRPSIQKRIPLQSVSSGSDAHSSILPAQQWSTNGGLQKKSALRKLGSLLFKGLSKKQPVSERAAREASATPESSSFAEQTPSDRPSTAAPPSFDPVTFPNSPSMPTMLSAQSGAVYRYKELAPAVAHPGQEQAGADSAEPADVWIRQGQSAALPHLSGPQSSKTRSHPGESAELFVRYPSLPPGTTLHPSQPTHFHPPLSIPDTQNSPSGIYLPALLETPPKVNGPGKPARMSSIRRFFSPELLRRETLRVRTDANPEVSGQTVVIEVSESAHFSRSIQNAGREGSNVSQQPMLACPPTTAPSALLDAHDVLSQSIPAAEHAADVSTSSEAASDRGEAAANPLITSV